MSAIEEHDAWLARGLDEDFGVDAEAELAAPEPHGDILKLQFKTVEHAVVENGRVRFTVEEPYVRYADSCRYPVVLVLICLARKAAWYLWLQEWSLLNRPVFGPRAEQGSWTVWVDASETLDNGLQDRLRDVARWRGRTQLALSLRDALRAAASTGQTPTCVEHVLEAIASTGMEFPPRIMAQVFEEAAALGQQLRATQQGNEVEGRMQALVARFGDQMNAEAVGHMVLRGEDGYSRAGVNALSLLYDQHAAHVKSLGLFDYFMSAGMPQLAYYCALRESMPPGSNSWDLLMGPPKGFESAGLRFHFDEDDHTTGFHDKYANRWASAILDYLVPTTSPGREDSRG